MTELCIYRAAEFPAVLEWQVRDFVRIVWSASHVDDPSIPLGDPTRDRVNFVIVDGDMLISHAQVTTFSIEHAEETYRVAGIGGVLTYPNFRKGGYGAQVVAAATQHIAASGVDFGMLFTNPDLEKFYTHNGWLVIPNLTIMTGDKSNPRIRDEFTLMYPVSAHGQQAVKAFENAKVNVGPHLW
jgi:GNAT superfamily N-acetyltransferase